MKRILVTDAERGSAIAFVRSLARAGYEVTAAGAVPPRGGFSSS
jgi:NAD(P)-dependent dehydrogenase (short-subunit alcohol dehydrogenase family)